MPFVPHTVSTRPQASGMSAALRKSRGNSLARLVLNFSSAAAADLEVAGGDLVEVLRGVDDEHGVLRVRKSGTGSAKVVARKVRGGGEYFALNLGHFEQFVDRSEPKLPCAFEKLDDGWIEVILPAWADETSPLAKAREVREPRVASPSRRPAVAEEQALRPALGRRLTSVTAQLNGDPAPGRSALVVSGAERVAEQNRLRHIESEARRESEAASVAERREQRSKVAAEVRLFGMDKRLLGVLADGAVHSKQELIAVSETKGGEPAVAAMISRLRKFFKNRGVLIEALTGQGYQMTSGCSIAKATLEVNP